MGGSTSSSMGFFSLGVSLGGFVGLAVFVFEGSDTGVGVDVDVRVGVRVDEIDALGEVELLMGGFSPLVSSSWKLSISTMTNRSIINDMQPITTTFFIFKKKRIEGRNVYEQLSLVINIQNLVRKSYRIK